MDEMRPADYAAINNGGMGFSGDNGWWLILLFLFAMNGGWGNNWNGNGGFAPWMYAGQTNTNNDVQRGFDQNYVMTGINGIQNAVNTGFANTSTQLCNGFAGVNQAVSNGFAQAEIANNARQMADMNQMFGLQSLLQNCCCENRAATADLKYTIATENCADRAAIGDGIQKIMDKLCDQELQAERRENANLRSQLNMATLAASQNAQTATISAGQRALANEVEQYVSPKAVPAYIVQNPNCCPQNYGCGYAA